jgi:NitT/TauT family transport system ATP-binding protein
VAAHLKKTWDSRSKTLVFRDFDLEVKPGEFVSIFGGNGCGKTTLLYILAKLENPDAGTVAYFPTEDNQEMAFVFQDYRGALFNWLTVFENITFRCGDRRSVASRSLRKRVEDFLGRFELSALLELLDRYPYELSGGQCQLVAIARALLREPRVLFLDEPFASLDMANKNRLLLSIQSYWSEHRPTTFFVSHDIDDALLLAGRLVVVTGTPLRVVGEWNLDWPRPREVSFSVSHEFERVRREVKSTVLLGDQP